MAVAAAIACFIGIRDCLLFMFILSVTVAPVQIFKLAPDVPSYIVGIAYPVPAISTFTITIAASVLYLLVTGTPRSWLLAVPAYCALGIGFLAFWDTNYQVQSGVLHAFLAISAWIVGCGFASRFRIDQSEFACWLLLLVSMVLAVPSWAQWFAGTGADDYGDRAGGLFAHPATTGKIAVVVLCLALPMTRSLSTRISRLSVITVATAALAVLPTLSRANVLAVLLVLGGWWLMNAKAARMRVLVTGAIGASVVAYVFAPLLLSRFQRDPGGGDRPELYAAAMRQLPNIWPIGTGPNFYVPMVSPREPIVAATGYPVHNAVVLFLAETGLLGLIGVAALAACCGWAIIDRNIYRSQGRVYQQGLLLMLASVLFISWTGWGTLRQPVLEFVVFGVAVCYTNATFYRSRSLSLDNGQSAFVGRAGYDAPDPTVVLSAPRDRR
ncbi:O-antigen ligase family protein [Gordonia jacobaea]|uniref:O-antigen ligase family protein n=1 Tax=Gordonia jacobaea TaxID=122202 RepID=UPI003D72D047